MFRAIAEREEASLVTTAAEANPLHGLMIRGMPDATQLLYAVHVVPVNPQPAANAPHAGKNPKLTGPTTRYSIDFMIRWTDLKLDAAADKTHTGRLQIELLAYDRAGNAMNWTGGTQQMSLKPDIFEAVQKSGVPAHAEIDLPSDQDIYLETGVYDWQTGKAGTLEIALPKQAAPDQASVLPQSKK